MAKKLLQVTFTEDENGTISYKCQNIEFKMFEIVGMLTMFYGYLINGRYVMNGDRIEIRPIEPN